MKTIALSLMLIASSAANAQDIGSILGGVLGNSTSSGSSQTGSLISTLTSIFSSSKQATAQKIVGTWNYSEPAIVLQSSNILTQTVAKAAANKMETQLQSYLTRYGIKPGTFSMTFKEDGTFTETLGTKTTSGTWKVQDSKLLLTVGGIKTVSVTTQLDGNNMQFVTDATKLLTLFKTFGAKSTNSNLKTITSLMKNVNGMQAGLTLKKQ